MKQKLSKAARAADRVGDTVREKVIGYLLAGLGFVAGLAWNEAVKASIDMLLKEGDTLLAKYIYAFAVTLLVVIVTLILVYFTKTPEKELKKKK